jgi:hypothetical protein
MPEPEQLAAQAATEAPTRPLAGASGDWQPAYVAGSDAAGERGPGDTRSGARIGVAGAPKVARSRGRGVFSPRLGLLAALLFNPIVLIAYLLYLYGPVRTCVAGSLCSFGSFPAGTQALLILAGCAALWLLLYALVLRAIEAPGRGTGLVRLLRDLSRYERIRELLLVYGALLALLLVVALLTGRLTMPAFVVGAFGIFVCLHCANAEPAEEEAPTSRHQGGEGARP